MNNNILIKLINMHLGKYLADIQVNAQVKESNIQVIDYLVKLNFHDKESIPVAIEIKRNLRPVTLQLLKSRFKNLNLDYKMLIADYISPPMASKLREMKIWFLDEVGNIHIDLPGKVYIFDTGHKRKTTEKRSSLITAANAKLFFFLLRTGPNISATYRHIAAKADVSLGKVSQLIGDLHKRQSLHYRKDKIVIRNPAKLLELWVEAYLEKLKPSMYLGTFTWPESSEFSYVKELSRQKVGIGGERGGELFTNYLKATSTDFWVDENGFVKLKKSLKLMESENGNIRVYKLFSKEMLFKTEETISGGVQVAHPLVVYADLIDDAADSRCHETAAMIKDKYLEWIK